MFAAANRFTVGEKRFMVTHNRSATSGKVGTMAILCVLFDWRYRRHTVSVATAACTGVQDLSLPLLLHPEREVLLN